MIALIGGATGMMLLAGMARLKLIALLLGPVGMGIAGVLDPTAQLAVQLGSLNIPSAALRFLPLATAERGERGFAWLYRALLRLLLLSAIIAAGITLVVALIWMRGADSGIGSHTLALAFCLAAVPLTAATNYMRNVLSTLSRYRAAGTAIFFSSVLLIAATYVGLRQGGLAGAYLGALLVAMLTVTLMHALIRPALPRVTGAESGSLLSVLRAHPDIVSYSMTLYAVGFAIPLSYWVVRWAVFGTLGERETGFLTASYVVAAGLRAVFSQASAQYLIPLASRTTGTALATEAARYVRTLLLLSLMAGLPLLLFPRELVMTLYSRAFLPAVGVLGLFIFAELVMSIGDNYRVMLLGLNDLRGCLAMTYGAAVAIIGGCFWVIPRFGLPGIAFLQLGTGAMVLLWAFFRLRSRHGIRVETRTLALIAYVVAALATGASIGQASWLPWTGMLAVKVAVATAVVFGGFALLPRLERRGIAALLGLGKGASA